jgi:hypothetical protein
MSQGPEDSCIIILYLIYERYSVTRNMYQLRPLVLSLGLNNPLRRQKDMFLQTGDSHCKMAVAGILSLAKLRAQMCATNKITVARIATVKSLNLRADCHRPDLTACIPVNLSAELGNPQSS